MYEKKSFAPLRNLLVFCLLLLPTAAFASTSGGGRLDLTGDTIGIVAVLIFILAYIMVMTEEFTHLRKSKPVILAAGIIWGLIAYVYVQHGLPDAAEDAVRHNLLEYAELFLFLLVAMTYINAMEERLVFDALKSWLIQKGFGYRKLFWLTGFLAFFISPVADNLTTALLMCAVLMAVGSNSPKFVGLGCINLVVAANAGGAFSPFGDITTLMVWQKKVVDFDSFFLLFVPALVNFVVPAAIMHFAVPNVSPDMEDSGVQIKRGGKVIVGLFFMTIVTAVSFHNFLNMPPVIGMMTGLAFLQIYGYYLRKTHYIEVKQIENSNKDMDGAISDDIVIFDVFHNVSRAEWDTLLFFYGVVLCVGGLGFIGYLTMVSNVMYGEWGATNANIAVGLLSAIVDNIPVMFAVLKMQPDMSLGQWLLVTMTAGVGGSLLSIGSAAGVGLMGQAKGKYTFFTHLKWMPAILLGFAASIATHIWINAGTFHLPPAH